MCRNLESLDKILVGVTDEDGDGSLRDNCRAAFQRVYSDGTVDDEEITRARMD